MKNYAAVLALPMQRRLFLASIPADFSDWLDYVAIFALLAYAWNEGPLTLALLALAFTVPHVLIGPWLAAAVDRADLRTVLLISNVGRALATGALVLAPDAAWLLAIVFLRGIADSAFTPARQSAIQRLTPIDLLPAANGLHQAVNQTSKIAGPALGGLLLALMPAQSIFILNAVLSLIAAAILLGLKPPRVVSEAREEEPLREQLTAGFAEFAQRPVLRAVLVFAATAYFAFFLYDTLIVLLADGLGYDQTAFGLTITASGLGGLIGAAAAGAMRARRPILVMSLAALTNGVTTLALAATTMAHIPIPFAVFCMAMAVMGGCTAFILVPYRTLIQANAPPDRVARVFAAGEAVTIAVMMAAPFAGSLIAGLFGVPAAFAAGGLVLLLLALASGISGAREEP